jgi:hypothetical protein
MNNPGLLPLAAVGRLESDGENMILNFFNKRLKLDMEPIGYENFDGKLKFVQFKDLLIGFVKHKYYNDVETSFGQELESEIQVEFSTHAESSESSVPGVNKMNPFVFMSKIYGDKDKMRLETNLWSVRKFTINLQKDTCGFVNSRECRLVKFQINWDQKSATETWKTAAREGEESWIMGDGSLYIMKAGGNLMSSYNFALDLDDAILLVKNRNHHVWNNSNERYSDASANARLTDAEIMATLETFDSSYLKYKFSTTDTYDLTRCSLVDDNGCKTQGVNVERVAVYTVDSEQNSVYFSTSFVSGKLGHREQSYRLI